MTTNSSESSNSACDRGTYVLKTSRSYAVSVEHPPEEVKDLTPKPIYSAEYDGSLSNGINSNHRECSSQSSSSNSPKVTSRAHRRKLFDETLAPSSHFKHRPTMRSADLARATPFPPASRSSFSHALHKHGLGEQQPRPQTLNGYLLLFSTCTFFVCFVYAAVISKFLPHVGHPLLDWIKDDTYYCFLVPFLIPVTLVAVFFNWIGLKIFRHN